MKIFSNSQSKVTDPVCGMLVDPCKSDLTAKYEDRCFYFCAQTCLDSFKKNPEKYAEIKSRGRSGWWGRYLTKLNKATDGRSMKCH
ncbi:MAG: YHS domain-containing protein [Deltaproteobacteria bacterium]|jgi:YHS domain-containing protein|nr:YHS domain-containing protein [Deltaproteobacteria bacterium]